MKLYKCDLCGRVFSQYTPHKCYGNCFRKHCLTFTEFEDDDYEYVKKPKIMPQGALILQEQAEPKIEFMVNWEQERVNIAKDTMRDILKQAWDDSGFKKELVDWTCKKGQLLHEYIANSSVMYADALIAELKKEQND